MSLKKHFTLNRSDGGVDSAFSLEPNELKILVEDSKRAFLSIGSIQLDSQKSEIKSKQFKRSIYAIDDIKIGDQFSKNNIKVIRPGDGLSPKFWEKLLKEKATKNYKKGSPIR